MARDDGGAVIAAVVVGGHCARWVVPRGACVTVRGLWFVRHRSWSQVAGHASVCGYPTYLIFPVLRSRWRSMPVRTRPFHSAAEFIVQRVRSSAALSLTACNQSQSNDAAGSTSGSADEGGVLDARVAT